MSYADRKELIFEIRIPGNPISLYVNSFSNQLYRHFGISNYYSLLIGVDGNKVIKFI